jgi:hypothetical protein
MHCINQKPKKMKMANKKKSKGTTKRGYRGGKKKSY